MFELLVTRLHGYSLAWLLGFLVRSLFDYLVIWVLVA